MWVLVKHNHHWNGDAEINLRKTERTTDREAACACFVHDECLHKWSLVQSSLYFRCVGQTTEGVLYVF